MSKNLPNSLNMTLMHSFSLSQRRANMSARSRKVIIKKACCLFFKILHRVCSTLQFQAVLTFSSTSLTIATITSKAWRLLAPLSHLIIISTGFILEGIKTSRLIKLRFILLYLNDLSYILYSLLGFWGFR